MAFRHFRTGVTWRVILFSLLTATAIYLWIDTSFPVTAVVLSILSIGSVINLIKYVELTNQKLVRFLDSIRYSDFSLAFPDDQAGSSFSELNRAFTDVIEKFKQERTERQESLRYLETVVQHIGVGLIVFNRKGDVVLQNVAVKRMLGIPVLRHIDSLKSINLKLYEAVKNLRGGERTLAGFELNNNRQHWAVHSTEFVMRNDTYKLVSLQNISSELDEKEMEAWQNLTQVLAHEIMNSITPIASLSDTVYSLLKREPEKGSTHCTIENETLYDVQEALDTIKNRSYGLMRFVQSYRDFTQIPSPDLEIIPVSQLLSRISQLMRGEFENKSISVMAETTPENLTVSADPQLIEQVLINLTKNALRALQPIEKPEIKYKGRLNEAGKICIEVHDNGPGIDKELQGKIFIPFYTNPGAGSTIGTGIGLSLSRQIMRLHNGSLRVQSEPGKGTVFILQF
ncbi:MAG: PAS domain-containing sensor histidine kinase [Balneolaceae bacterium]